MIVGAKKKSNKIKNETKGVIESNDEMIQKFIDARDYKGASTFINFINEELKQPLTKEKSLWLGYCLFHQGQYSDAIEVYEKLLKEDPKNTILNLYIASCHFYNKDFDESRHYAFLGPQCDFRTRLLFHIAHQTNDEQEFFKVQSQLGATLENQLSLAAVHYMRSHYQESIEIYQRLLLQHPDFLALHVYIAMCQFKLDQYEESNESVDTYLSDNSDSAIALNLKSCDYLKLFDSEIAQSQLLQIRKFSSSSYDFVDSIVTHNLCIFQNGEDGFTILPKLVPILNEARYNLAILHMRSNESLEAYSLLKDYNPIQLNESILKASVLLSIGQLQSDLTSIEEAKNLFSKIGNMKEVKDTILGREALASSKFINGQYSDALKVLNTIEEYESDEDEYNYNKAMTLAALSKYSEAEKYFLSVKSPQYTKEIYYIQWLCKCFIKNNKADDAWKLYLDATTTDESKALLNIIAADCYQSGQFYYAMRAYDVLSKYDMSPELKEGMIAAAVGTFRDILAKKEGAEKLPEIIGILADEPDAESIVQIIQQYAIDSGELDF
ncbi:TPR Domain containing protein [Histomonas meleagridis]|uniref:TPR Domain containing protein n=1 Tax=Histomonas meleagridis TaxID=135588 RepID=UPI00355A3E62|nr:TPR Domain containing protein [Histomonas meleagridis]KAH0803481.1 TPR Domain containing protein [Histomonas meleagridis]